MKLQVIMLILSFQNIVLFSQNNLDLSFESDTLVLNGTLQIPNNNKHKHPVILFVHGSGPGNRDQTSPIIGGNASCLYPNLLNDTIRNFKDISEYLSQNGYATFRYDKRTLTYSSSLNQQEITPYDFIDDIESAIDFLKTRNDIDTNCITLLGHSQGGGLIPYVATKRNDIKNMICLASPSTPIDTLFAEQLRDIYAECGDSTLGYSYYTQSLNAYGQMRAGTWNMNTAVNGAYPKFWIDWIHLSDSVIYNTNLANIPTYHSFGENDFNVPFDEKITFENNLTNDFEINTFQDCNHFLTSSTEPTVREDLLISIKAWLDSQECATTINSISKVGANYKFKTYDNHYEIELELEANYSIVIFNELGVKLYEDEIISNRLVVKKTKAQGLQFLKVTNNENEIVLLKTISN